MEGTFITISPTIEAEDSQLDVITEDSRPDVINEVSQPDVITTPITSEKYIPETFSVDKLRDINLTLRYLSSKVRYLQEDLEYTLRVLEEIVIRTRSPTPPQLEGDPNDQDIDYVDEIYSTYHPIS